MRCYVITSTRHADRHAERRVSGFAPSALLTWMNASDLHVLSC